MTQKQPKVSPSLEGVAAMAAQDDLMALAKPQRRAQGQTFQAGHNIAVDLRQPDRITIVIPRDPEWNEEHLLSVPPGAKSKSKTPTLFLAKTASNFGGIPVEIDGRALWFKLELQLQKDGGQAE